MLPRPRFAARGIRWADRNSSCCPKSDDFSYGGAARAEKRREKHCAPKNSISRGGKRLRRSASFDLEKKSMQIENREDNRKKGVADLRLPTADLSPMHAKSEIQIRNCLGHRSVFFKSLSSMEPMVNSRELRSLRRSSMGCACGMSAARRDRDAGSSRSSRHLACENRNFGASSWPASSNGSATRIEGSIDRKMLAHLAHLARKVHKISRKRACSKVRNRLRTLRILIGVCAPWNSPA